MTRKDIPENIMLEIDFMLGSIEECNSGYLLPILKEHNLNPHGGWIDIDQVPDGVIIDIYRRLF